MNMPGRGATFGIACRISIWIAGITVDCCKMRRIWRCPNLTRTHSFHVVHHSEDSDPTPKTSTSPSIGRSSSFAYSNYVIATSQSLPYPSDISQEAMALQIHLDVQKTQGPQMSASLCLKLCVQAIPSNGVNAKKNFKMQTTIEMPSRPEILHTDHH